MRVQEQWWNDGRKKTKLREKKTFDGLKYRKVWKIYKYMKRVISAQDMKGICGNYYFNWSHSL